MEEDDYHLKWAKHHDAFVSVFEYLHSKEILVDCTLAAEDQFIKAHRIVLMACSPYLHEVLNEYSTDYPILFLDIKFSELKAIVHFCYRGEVTVAHNELESFLKAASVLKIKGLCGKDMECNNEQNESADDTVGDVIDAEMVEDQHRSKGAQDGMECFPHMVFMNQLKEEAEGSDNSDDDSDISSIGAEDLENMDGSGFVQTAQTGGNIIFPWTCTRCGEAFPTRVLHDQHRKTCVIYKDLPWKCEQCPNTYKNKKDLVRHLIYCGKDLPRLVCNRCGNSYKYGRGLKRHLKYCGKDVEPLKCPDCDKTFKYTRGLRRHQRRCGIMEALAKLAEKGVTPVLIRKKAGWNDSESPPKDEIITSQKDQIIVPVTPSTPALPTKKVRQEVSEGEQTPLSTPSVCVSCGKAYKYKRAYQRHLEICVATKVPIQKEDFAYVSQKTKGDDMRGIKRERTDDEEKNDTDDEKKQDSTLEEERRRYDTSEEERRKDSSSDEERRKGEALDEEKRRRSNRKVDKTKRKQDDQHANSAKENEPDNAS